MQKPKKQNRKTVALGMSGGLDSTMAAWLLRQQGYRVIGLTMSIWDNQYQLDSTHTKGCYGPAEGATIAAAEKLAAQLEMPHYTIKLAAEYEHWVMSNFKQQYLAGYTPNPCAICNPIMKFKLLPQKARAQGIEFDYFATGHYARITQDAPQGPYRLWRGLDQTKDQSYFLSRLDQHQLSGTLFPLGAKTKQEVRQLAQSIGLDALAAKGESQDFLQGDAMTQLFDPTLVPAGAIVDTQGTVLGEHRGIVHYTIGQRDGLGVALGYRAYVKTIDAARNLIVLGKRAEVMSHYCHINHMHWIAGHPPPTGTPLQARVRYRHPGATATLRLLKDDQVVLHFQEPQFAITPGQLAALYQGDEVLGGGWIVKPADQKTEEA